ncbi:four helix bundle protein [Candidatus Saccharibacteria bacterium]|nr:four helix bundle protein [Candidatus Saccharibacteria bacterium]
MDNKRKSNEILEQMLELSERVIKYTEQQRNIPRSVGDQLIRSITAIGANYAEAQDASSKKVEKLVLVKGK